MYISSLFLLPTKPTRVTDTTTTLINHIWTTQVETNVGNYIINSDNSDNFPILSQFKQEVASHPPTYVNKRTIIDFALNNFKNGLYKVN